MPAAFLIVRREEARVGGPEGGGGGGGEAVSCDFGFGFCEKFACFERVDGDPKISLKVFMIRGKKVRSVKCIEVGKTGTNQPQIMGVLLFWGDKKYRES